MSGGMEIALVAVRLAQFAAAMTLLGSSVFALGMAWGVSEKSPTRPAFEQWLSRILLLAGALALISALFWLDLEAAIMGDDWNQALDPSTVRAVLLGTEFGRAWCWHLGIGCVLLVMLRIVPLGRPGLVLLAGLAGAFVASLAWAGHAVMHPGAMPLLVQTIHLLAGGLWVGSLPALTYLVAQARHATPGADLVLRRMLVLYARAAYVAVSLVLVTGLFNSAFLVDRPGALVITAFGRVLLVKILLVVAMLVFAARNRFVLTPAVIAGRSAAMLWSSVVGELCVGVLVLAAVSLLGTLPPALHR